MSKKNKTAITPTRNENYPEWYQQVIKAAELAENSPVRGCMVIKPWGFAIWERMQQCLDKMFKDTGHVNAYFPLLIPLSFLEKEAEHVDGFAKECAVVTHHRLEADDKGGLKPAGELDEPLIIRPTSETIIGETYAKWVQSYRDLPILINQWANVMRWEMRTRLFLRTSEFLWQEGHTVHATDIEAKEETAKMLAVYKDFAENFMAMPVLAHEKPIDERFPGAVSTYSIEALMQDNKALQAGTSHFLGQNFSKAANIRFVDKDEQEKLAWTTSWGVSTRLIGGLIMSHADDNGLILPPMIAPEHIRIIPVYRKEEDRQKVLEACENLKSKLLKKTFANESLRVGIDITHNNSGNKLWKATKQGVPLRVEIGPRDIEKGALMLQQRTNTDAKNSVLVSEFIETAPQLLSEMQSSLLSQQQQRVEASTQHVSSWEEIKKLFKSKETPGYVIAPTEDFAGLNDKLKPLKITARCTYKVEDEAKCIFSGKSTHCRMVYAKAY